MQENGPIAEKQNTERGKGLDRIKRQPVEKWNPNLMRVHEKPHKVIICQSVDRAQLPVKTDNDRGVTKTTGTMEQLLYEDSLALTASLS